MVKGDFKSSEAQADYGYVIKKYKEKIKKGNVILVVNLNDVSFSNVVKIYKVQYIFDISPRYRPKLLKLFMLFAILTIL